MERIYVINTAIQSTCRGFL